MNSGPVKILVVLALLLTAAAVGLAAGYKPINPDQAQVSLSASPYLVHPSADKISLSTSATVVASLSGLTALPTDTIGILVANLDSSVSLHISFDGTAATAADWELTAGKGRVIRGNRSRIADIRLFAPSAIDVNLEVHELY